MISHRNFLKCPFQLRTRWLLNTDQNRCRVCHPPPLKLKLPNWNATKVLKHPSNKCNVVSFTNVWLLGYIGVYICRDEDAPSHFTITHIHTHMQRQLQRYLRSIALFSLLSFHSIKPSLPSSLFSPSLSLSVSCTCKRRGQAQTAWERLTTRGFKQRYIKGRTIFTAAYTHPHIHKHWLTYLGLLSLKFITSDRTITLLDSACESTTRGESSA